MVNLVGKAAFVTGAARGIGKAIAKSFLDAGARVWLADISESVFDAAKALDPSGAKAAGIVLDVRDEAAFEAAFARASGDGGPAGGDIDILVNNVALTIAKPVWDIPAAEWDDVQAVNLRGTFFGCRIAGRHMRDRRRGRIINISSMAGERGGAVAGAHYATSKAGIIVLTKMFAQELAGSGVTVNCIAPAAIRGPITDEMPADKVAAMAKMIPVGRLGDDREVGMAAAYLASDLAAFVTGTTLDVNGGLFMR
jgi:3-oxoacyl-[acyl-carrier protein] reductase